MRWQHLLAGVADAQGTLLQALRRQVSLCHNTGAKLWPTVELHTVGSGCHFLSITHALKSGEATKEPELVFWLEAELKCTEAYALLFGCEGNLRDSQPGYSAVLTARWVPS